MNTLWCCMQLLKPRDTMVCLDAFSFLLSVVGSLLRLLIGLFVRSIVRSLIPLFVRSMVG